MRVLPPFRLHRPRSIEEALETLALHRDRARLLAGGTDLVVNLQNRVEAPEHLVSLGRIAELRGIESLPDGRLRLGALVSIAEIAASPLIRERWEVLASAARSISTPSLRGMGTLGGNLCLDTRCHWFNQSASWRQACGFCLKKDGDICHVARSSPVCVAAYSADLAPALLVLDATVVLRSAAEERELPLGDFFLDDGTRRLVRQPDEMLVETRLPGGAAGRRGVYHKVRARGAIDFPLAGVAAAGRWATDGSVTEAAVALTAVAPRPFRVEGIETALCGRAPSPDAIEEAAERAWAAAHPLHTGGPFSPAYRKLRVRVATRRALEEITSRNSRRR